MAKKDPTDQFCKIFQVGEHQVLYRLQINTEEVNNKLEISMVTFITGLEFAGTMSGFESDERCLANFEKINQEMAEKYFNAMKKFTS